MTTTIQIGKIQMIANTGTYIDSPFHRYANGRIGFCALYRFIALVVVMASCGESREDQANRAALASIAQRNQALNLEFTDWVRGAEQRQDTWQNSFDKYARLIADKEEVRKDLRAVVPTKRFACLTEVLARSIERDIQLLHAIDSYTRQMFQASFAAKQAQSLHEQGMASTYSYEMYFRLAKEAREELSDAIEQAKSHRKAANTASRLSLATSDTVRALIQELKLLSATPAPSFPILTDSGPDSFAEGSKTAIKPRCGQ